MKIGTTLRNLREDRNITQKNLSLKCGISQTYLSQIENDRKSPTLHILDILGDKLGVPIPVILFLSLTEEDVKSDKRHLYKMTYPSIKKIIQEFFVE